MSTVDAVQRELMEDGFVLRYRTSDVGAVDGLLGREGAFLACSFWLVDCLHMIGRTDEAQALFERLIGLVNDLGLLSEEYYPFPAPPGRQLSPGLLPRVAGQLGVPALRTGADRHPDDPVGTPTPQAARAERGKSLRICGTSDPPSPTGGQRSGLPRPAGVTGTAPLTGWR